MNLLVFSAAAQACGGFFCTPAIEPVEQAAEEIVFLVDDGQTTGEPSIEMHVGIEYQGDAADFAWVVPVPAEPELFVSSEQMFDELRTLTNPVFRTEFRATEGRCGPMQVNLGCAADAALKSAPQDASSVATVVDQAQVGPFETTTLQATSREALTTWLRDNDYDLPGGLDPLLDPYIAGNSFFVAMRLAPDASTGDIEPIGLSFPGSKMAIPIQLTAVAAASDMPVRVYVFADHRAAPESYVHVQINEAAIDWPSGGANYPEVLARAADEAGSQAFVTEYAGRFPYSTVLDPTLKALLQERAYVTRMTTALSADEMTVDPTFVVNPDLPDVSNIHTAEVFNDCTGPQSKERTWLTLPDGREVNLGEPDGGLTKTPNIARLEEVPALVVEDLTEGRGEILADFRKEATASLDAYNAAAEAKGCGCNSDPVPRSMALASLLLVTLLRRRSAAD